MKQRTIIIILVIIMVVLLGAIGYLLIQNLASNNTTNNTTNNTISNISQGTTPVNQTTPSNTNVNISAAKAKSIASDYLTSTNQGENLTTGTPSLKGGIYYVPMVVTNNEGQHAKGTVVGYVKVDAETGQVFGIQEIMMY